MHLDHLIFATGPLGLDTEASKLAKLLEAKDKDGGFHPRFGTRNHIIPLTQGRYLEIVEVLDHPSAEKAPFGQAVRARTEFGGGWLGWVIAVNDLAPYEKRLHRSAVLGSRHFPDGRLLQWEQIGVKGLIADPQLPFFIHWLSDELILPRALKGKTALQTIEISGSKDRVSDWLQYPIEDGLDGVEIKFVAPNGLAGISSVTFKTPSGKLVTI